MGAFLAATFLDDPFMALAFFFGEPAFFGEAAFLGDAIFFGDFLVADFFFMAILSFAGDAILGATFSLLASTVGALTALLVFGAFLGDFRAAFFLATVFLGAFFFDGAAAAAFFFGDAAAFFTGFFGDADTILATGAGTMAGSLLTAAATASMMPCDLGDVFFTGDFLAGRLAMAAAFLGILDTLFLPVEAFAEDFLGEATAFLTGDLDIDFRILDLSVVRKGAVINFVAVTQQIKVQMQE